AVRIVGAHDARPPSCGAATIDQAHPYVIRPLSPHDAPPICDHLSVTGASVTTGLGGVTVAAGGQTITYDPGSAYNYLAVDESATDRIGYAIYDTHVVTSNAVSSVTDDGVTDAPTASDDAATT